MTLCCIYVHHLNICYQLCQPVETQFRVLVNQSSCGWKRGGCNLLMEILRRALYSKDVALQANPGSWQQQQLLQSQGPGPE